MVNKWETMDRTAPLPFIRRCPDYKADTTKYEFEREKTSVKTVVTTAADNTTTTIKSTETYKKETKVTLKVYSHSAEEDAEHFFEAFEHMKKKLKPEWTNASNNKKNDATILFDAFDGMLEGTAEKEWHDVLGTEASRTWEMFKTKVSEFICTKILPPNAYNEQINYMSERAKPMKLTAQQWWARYQTLNAYLPYMIRTKDRLQAEVPGADFSHWWIKGSISPAASKRAILNKIPDTWDTQLKRNDVGNEHREKKDTQQLVDWFTTLEAEEEKEKSKKSGKQAHQDSSNRRRRDERHERRGRTSRTERNERYRNNRSGHGSDQHRTGRQSNNSNHDRERRRPESQYDRRPDRRYERNDNRYNRNREENRPNKNESHAQREISSDEDEAHLIDVWNDHYSDVSSESTRSETYYYSSNSSTDVEERRPRR